MRILIAEDSPTLGRDLRDALVRDGHVVDVATDGEQAMHFLASFSYDVVTLMRDEYAKLNPYRLGGMP